MNNQSNWIAHHGILGMKWGIRRYQNEDGTLTPAGIKRYSEKADRMSNKKLYRMLKKQIRDARQAQNGHIYDRINPKAEIGKKSKSMRDQYNNDVKKWTKSEKFRKWESEWDGLYRKLDQGKIDIDEYDKQAKELEKRKPVPNFRDLGYAYVFGEGYANDYIKKGGKDLSIARLEDLGYDKKSAEKYVNRLIKSGLTLGGI